MTWLQSNDQNTHLNARCCMWGAPSASGSWNIRFIEYSYSYWIKRKHRCSNVSNLSMLPDTCRNISSIVGGKESNKSQTFHHAPCHYIAIMPSKRTPYWCNFQKHAFYPKSSGNRTLEGEKKHPQNSLLTDHQNKRVPLEVMARKQWNWPLPSQPQVL